MNEGRHHIKRFAKKARLHRGATSFKLPHEKKQLALFRDKVEAVVLIMASGACEGVSFPQADTWECWAEGSRKVGFCLYVEEPRGVAPFWRPFVCPVTRSSAWGEFPLVKAELDALQWAARTYANANWFYVVSGDSIPVKRVRDYVTGPPASVLGFPEQAAKFDHGVTFPSSWPQQYVFEHSQWKVLTRHHVELIVTGLIPKLDEWRSVHRRLKNKLCCSIAPDEWVIGTFLRNNDPVGEFSLGQCMMELEYYDEWRACCKAYTGHAKEWVWGDSFIQEAVQDPTSWALRKVPERIGRSILNLLSLSP